ncbi:unnamed protein product [Paramecium pentaurelia]|uniref:Uncharacterized protein n=1 Tax=Paramecium pentaurelia TaxID=43138 RepID=A0A8S1WDB0_9CILI|nr:unnamed protein product [Paramecium pentaurelia]
MIIDDKIQKILTSNDFQRVSDKQKLSRSEFTEQSNKSNGTNELKPKKRRVVKLKNQLLSSHVSPDIQKLYYQSQKIETEQQRTGDKIMIEEKKPITLPSLQKKEQVISEQSSKTNLGDLIMNIQEIFPPDHQLWRDLQVGDQSIEDVIVQNQDYFSDLLMLYLQEMEIKSLKNKKLGCKGKYSTQYTDDYNDKFMKDSTYINRWIYERAKQSAAFMQNSSTYNQHFVPQRFEKSDNFKPDHLPNQNTMSCLSSYTANFRDWKKQYHGIIGPFYVQSDKKLPFIAETNYSRNFVTQKYEKQDPIIPKPLGPFPVETQSLVRETTHKTQFSLPQNWMENQSIISPRNIEMKSFEGYQPHFNKQQQSPQVMNSFADRFFHSSVVQQLMKKNQKQIIN